MKQQLIKHLKERDIKDVQALWDKTKEFYKSKGITTNGGYSPMSGHISVIVLQGGHRDRFQVRLDEIK